MSGTIAGVKLARSRSIGITVVEYDRQLALARKWCCAHRAFHPLGDFMRDVSRGSGYASICRQVRRGRQRRAHLAHRYGLSPQDFELLMVKQQRRCAICADPFLKRPHVDHDHSTGLVRGLLCFRCNAMIGSAREHPDILGRAIRYLRGSQ